LKRHSGRGCRHQGCGGVAGHHVGTDMSQDPEQSETRPISPWMPPAVAAAYLGISLGTLRNWTSARFIPFAKKGRIVRYHKDVIDKWLAKGGCPGRATIADLAE
jgi:excisionase family DNA binding protein